MPCVLPLRPAHCKRARLAPVRVPRPVTEELVGPRRRDRELEVNAAPRLDLLRLYKVAITVERLELKSVGPRALRWVCVVDHYLTDLNCNLVRVEGVGLAVLDVFDVNHL